MSGVGTGIFLLSSFLNSGLISLPILPGEGADSFVARLITLAECAEVAVSGLAVQSVAVEELPD